VPLFAEQMVSLHNARGPWAAAHGGYCNVSSLTAAMVCYPYTAIWQPDAVLAAMQKELAPHVCHTSTNRV
jgi:hypothetical protein